MAKRYIIICPECKSRYLYSDDYKGQSVECPNCKKSFAVDKNIFEEDDGSDQPSVQQSSAPTPSAQTPIPSDKIEAKCGKCGYSALLPLSLSGKSVKCPKCSNVFTVGDMGGFEVVNEAPQQPEHQTQRQAVQPVKIQFAKDVAIAWPVTITYMEKKMVRFAGKIIPKLQEKTITGRLGETIRVPIQQPTTLKFKIGGMCGSGKVDAQPEAKYVVRRSGMIGCSWQATEVDVIGGQQGTFSGGLSFFGWHSGN